MSPEARPEPRWERIPVDDSRAIEARQLFEQHRQNEAGFKTLLDEDPDKFAGQWVAFGGGQLLVTRIRGVDKTEQDISLSIFLKEAKKISDELGLNFGAVYLTMLPSREQ